MSELEELKMAYAECSRQRNELLNKLKSQAQRKPLTEGEIQKLLSQNRFAVFALVRAIEAAHGIKENT